MAHLDKCEAPPSGARCSRKVKDSLSERITYIPSLLDKALTVEEYRKQYLLTHSLNARSNPCLPHASSSPFWAPTSQADESEFPAPITARDEDAIFTPRSNPHLDVAERSTFADHPGAKKLKFPLPPTPDEEIDRGSRANSPLDLPERSPSADRTSNHFSCFVPLHTNPPTIENLSEYLQNLKDNVHDTHLDPPTHPNPANVSKTRLPNTTYNIPNTTIPIPSFSEIKAPQLPLPKSHVFTSNPFLGSTASSALHLGSTSAPIVCDRGLNNKEYSTNTLAESSKCRTLLTESKINEMQSQFEKLEKANKEWAGLVERFEEMLLAVDGEKCKLREQIQALEQEGLVRSVEKKGWEDEKVLCEARIRKLEEVRERERRELTNRINTLVCEKTNLVDEQKVLVRDALEREKDEKAQEERIEDLECMVYDRGLEIDRLKVRIATLEKEAESTVHESLGEGKKHLIALTNEIHSLVSSLRAQSQDFNAHLEVLNKKEEVAGDRRKIEMLIESFGGMMNALNPEIEKQRSHVNLAEDQTVELLKINAGLEEEKGTLMVKIEGLEGEVDWKMGWMGERTRLLVKIQNLESELKTKVNLEGEKRDLLKQISDLEYNLTILEKFNEEFRDDDQSKRIKALEKKISDLEAECMVLTMGKDMLEQDKNGLFVRNQELSKRMKAFEGMFARREVTPPGQFGAMAIGTLIGSGKDGERIPSGSTTDSEGGLTRRMSRMKGVDRFPSRSSADLESLKAGGRGVSRSSKASNESFQTAICDKNFEDIYRA